MLNSEKYTSLNINNELTFINSLQFLSVSLDSFVRNLGKNDFKYLSHKFDSNVIHLGKQKGLYPYKYISSFANKKYVF